MLDTLLPSSFTATCLVGLIISLLVFWIQRRLRYRLPPGPTPLPLLGNMFQADSKILHKQAFEWSRKYGPVISVYIGPIHLVFVNNIETVLEVLVKKSSDFANRIRTTSINVLTNNGKDIISGDYGQTWSLHRKIASKALRAYMRGDKLDQRVWTAVTNAMDAMEKHTEPFEIKEHLTYMMADLLLGLCFGGRVDYNDKSLQRILRDSEMFFEVSNIYLEDFIPPLRHIYKTKSFRKLEDHIDFFKDFLNKKFEKEECTFDKDNLRHFVDHLLLARLEAEQEEGSEAVKCLTKTHLLLTCCNIFFAGIDTSSITLNFAILYMLKYPDIQEKVQAEIDEAVCADRLPGVADRPNLSYTEAVLHESMRLSTAAPLGLFHKTTCDTSVAGYDIPVGTPVAINHWALHNDPDAWQDVDKFIPERFLDENGQLGPKPQNWLPFSAGKRVCLGEFVAKPELHLFFAALMQRFTWKPEPGVTPDLSSVGNFFGQRPQPYKVVIKKRF